MKDIHIRTCNKYSCCQMSWRMRDITIYHTAIYHKSSWCKNQTFLILLALSTIYQSKYINDIIDKDFIISIGFIYFFYYVFFHCFVILLLWMIFNYALLINFVFFNWLIKLKWYYLVFQQTYTIEFNNYSILFNIKYLLLIFSLCEFMQCIHNLFYIIN